MADRLRWGILATGGIAHQFAGGLKVSKTGELVATGSRTLESATNFAEKHGGKPYGSYDEVLTDPEVDAVYIALPHHMHMDWTIRTAKAGKGILCEKPFTLNAIEAELALKAVRENGVFFMEAFMYRCHPQTLQLKKTLAEGSIGKPLVVNSEFGFNASRDWDNFRADAAVGGGGLMDVGTYCVSLTRLVAGEEPDRLHYAAQIGAKGYDETGSGCLGFPSGLNGHFATGVHVNLQNDARIYGDKGWIHIENPWKVGKDSKMTVYGVGLEPEIFDLGCTNDELYGFEADAVAEYWEAKECPHMTLADTMGQMRALDALRSSAEISFEAELKK